MTTQSLPLFAAFLLVASCSPKSVVHTKAPPAVASVPAARAVPVAAAVPAAAQPSPDWLRPELLSGGLPAFEDFCAGHDDCSEVGLSSGWDGTPWGEARIVRREVEDCILVQQVGQLWFQIEDVPCLHSFSVDDSASVITTLVNQDGEGQPELLIVLDESSRFDGDGEEEFSLESVERDTTRAAVCSVDAAEPACTPFFLTAFRSSGTIQYYDKAVNVQDPNQGDPLDTHEHPEEKWTVQLSFTGENVRIFHETGSLPREDAGDYGFLAQLGSYAWLAPVQGR